LLFQLCRKVDPQTSVSLSSDIVPFMNNAYLGTRACSFWGWDYCSKDEQEVLGRTNRLNSLIRHEPHWKRRVQQFLYCCVRFRYSGNISTEPFPSNDRGIFIEPSPSNDKGMFTEPLPGNDRGDTKTHTYTQKCNLIRLLNFWLTFLILKQEVLGRTNRIVSLIRYGPHWKRRVQQFFYCCVCIPYRGNVSTEPLPNSDRGIFTEPGRCLATIGGIHRHTHTQTHERTQTHKHRQQRNLISLPYFSK
jgi:hypothetical protein